MLAAETHRGPAMSTRILFQLARRFEIQLLHDRPRRILKFESVAPKPNTQLPVLQRGRVILIKASTIEQRRPRNRVIRIDHRVVGEDKAAEFESETFALAI